MSSEVGLEPLFSLVNCLISYSKMQHYFELGLQQSDSDGLVKRVEKLTVNLVVKICEWISYPCNLKELCVNFQYIYQILNKSTSILIS